MLCVITIRKQSLWIRRKNGGWETLHCNYRSTECDWLQQITAVALNAVGREIKVSVCSSRRAFCFVTSLMKHPDLSAILYKSLVLCIFFTHPSVEWLDCSVPPDAMTSEATSPIRTGPSTTPPLSPISPLSPNSLRLPQCRHRDRSPSPMRDFLIPSPLPTRRNRTFSAWVHTHTLKKVVFRRAVMMTSVVPLQDGPGGRRTGL